MKICITAQKDGLDSPVDPRFGRCQYFAVADTETSDLEFLENSNKDGMGGVGIQSSQFILGKGVQAVVTGNVGPNAFQTLQAAGIEVFTGAAGTVAEVLEKFKRGEFKSVNGPSVEAKHGGSENTEI